MTKLTLAIDITGMRAGRASADAYLSEWRQSTHCHGDPEQAVFEEVSRLEVKGDPA